MGEGRAPICHSFKKKEFEILADERFLNDRHRITEHSTESRFSLETNEYIVAPVTDIVFILTINGKPYFEVLNVTVKTSQTFRAFKQ